MTSMRGFSRRKLGPLDEDEAPLGGEALMELGAEIRFPIFGRLKGAVFLDIGQVWEERNGVGTGDLEYASGPSVMIETPIGPLRGDLGIRLTDHEESQPMQALHVSIGHPF